jgi:O-antigen/teichoic acid export membrane protein
MNQERFKQSLVLGGLTSSAGIFLTKIIGILYVVPFSALATEANLSYYARAYSIYEIVLNVSIAGMPYAIATLVAKYHLKEQYKNLLLVKKVSSAILALSGFLMMILLMFFALPLAKISIGTSVLTLEVLRTRNVMLIMALSVFTVPLLSSYRGFYQGLKELKLYASSQVLEQVARVSLLLGLGFMMVVVFGYDPIWAVYAAIFATALSALVSMVQFILKDRKTLIDFKKAAELSNDSALSVKTIMIELYGFSIPFLLSVVLNSMANFVNLLFFNQSLIAYGNSIGQADLYYSMVMFTTNKLTSIPQVIAPGFITAIIPYVTTSYEKKDTEALKKHVLDSLLVVFYLSLPLSYFLFGLAKPIYYVMYGNAHLDLGAGVLMLNSITGLSFNLSAVSNALMMAMRLRKQNLMVIFVVVLLATITFVPLLSSIGYAGSIISKFTSHLLMFFMNLYLIQRIHKIPYFKLFRDLLIMLLALLGMQISFMFLEAIGLNVVDHHRMMATFVLGLYGVLGTGVYYVITASFGLPQRILHFDLKRVFKR